MFSSLQTRSLLRSSRSPLPNPHLFVKEALGFTTTLAMSALSALVSGETLTFSFFRRRNMLFPPSGYTTKRMTSSEHRQAVVMDDTRIFFHGNR